MIASQLTRHQTNLLKGIGMLMIMIHNFYHLLSPSPGQNEFDFSIANFQKYVHLSQLIPLDFLRYGFSYFGHYGVQIFIFISSYGLYLSYRKKEIHLFPFLKQRLIKLYPMLVIAVILLLIVSSAYSGFPDGEKLRSILLKLTLLFNFIPGEALTVSGPWWFFSLIFQLYLAFPFLLNLIKRYGRNSMLITAAVFILITIPLNPVLVRNDLSLYYTFIGQMPVFCLGIYFADRGNFKMNAGIIILSILVFVFANVNQVIWNFGFIAFTLILLAFFFAARPYLRRFKRLNNFVAYTGKISLSLFAIHGMMRLPFLKIAEKYEHPFFTLVICLIFLAAAYVMAWFVRIAESRVQRLISKKADTGESYRKPEVIEVR